MKGLKKLKASDLRNLSADELRQKENDLRKELFNLKFLLSKGELPNNRRVKVVRKDIARVLTIITEKGVGNA
jgi:large subunit ribosomal protein L29